MKCNEELESYLAFFFFQYDEIRQISYIRQQIYQLESCCYMTDRLYVVHGVAAKLPPGPQHLKG